jgi:hypothetical protein
MTSNQNHWELLIQMGANDNMICYKYNHSKDQEQEHHNYREILKTCNFYLFKSHLSKDYYNSLY